MRYRVASRAVSLLPLLWIPIAVPVRAAEYTIRPGQDKNQVTFTSHATMETFDGKTRQVSGSLSLDPAQLGDTITVLVEVDLASLDTGIPMRNKHMRDNHLETAKYPKATFKGGHVLQTSNPGLETGKPVQLRLAGTFDLHGVTRPLEVPIEATRTGDGTIRVTTHFDVILSDYNISRPAFLLLKLEQTQHVTVQMTARPTP